MHLKDLKDALAKFPEEMDNAHILVQTGYNGVQQYDLLSFIATIPQEEFKNCLVLGTMEATRILVKEKKLRVPDDYVPGGEEDDPERDMM